VSLDIIIRVQNGSFLTVSCKFTMDEIWCLEFQFTLKFPKMKIASPQTFIFKEYLSTTKKIFRQTKIKGREATPTLTMTPLTFNKSNRMKLLAKLPLSATGAVLKSDSVVLVSACCCPNAASNCSAVAKPLT